MTLATSYLGLRLRNPLVASASPLTARIDNLRRLEDAGAGAIVLPSLFQEQIEAEAEVLSERIDAYAHSSPEAHSYFPPSSAAGPYGLGPERYLNLVRRAAASVSVPVIASLNGSSLAGWIDHARLIEQAGAAALELNIIHIPADLTEAGAAVEARYTSIVQAVCGSVGIPVTVKLTPHLSSVGHLATKLVELGAAGLVLFNRVQEPDIDPVQLKLTDRVSLGEPEDMRLPMLWTALLSGRVNASLAASGGVAGVGDVVKYLLAGADVVMTTSALLRHDAGYLAVLVNGLRQWMEARDFASLDEFRGMLSWRRGGDREAYTRANHLRILDRSVAL